MKAKNGIITGLILVLTGALQAQQVYIDALAGNGQLTVSLPSNADFTVEWVSSLTSGAWRNNWLDLQDIQCTNSTMTVDVPMYYRVTCWTNGLFMHLRVGRTYVNIVTNGLGEIWTEDLSVIGNANLPGTTNEYIVVTASHSWDTEMPAGAEDDAGIHFGRLTDDALYNFDPLTMQETIIERMGPVGTSWTNGDWNEVISVEAIDDIVTVPAGTFTDCIRYHTTAVGDTDPNHGQRYWIKPGLGWVREIKYANWVYPPEAAPVVWELQSWSDE